MEYLRTNIGGVGKQEIIRKLFGDFRNNVYFCERVDIR